MFVLIPLARFRSFCEWLAVSGASGDCVSYGCGCFHLELWFKAGALAGAAAAILIHVEERRRGPFSIRQLNSF